MGGFYVIFSRPLRSILVAAAGDVFPSGQVNGELAASWDRS